MGRGKKKGIAIASHLLKHTQTQALQTGLPVLHFFSNDQKGNSFGERLSNALTEGFAAGYERLIVCGTDSPNINTEQLQSVSKKLNKHQLVLGPTVDGGVYIIGIHKNSFAREAFVQIPWLSTCVFKALKKHAALHQFSLYIETKEADINNQTALLNWCQEHPANWLTKLVDRLFFIIEKYCSLHFFSFAVSSLHSPGRRGPPHL